MIKPVIIFFAAGHPARICPAWLYGIDWCDNKMTVKNMQYITVYRNAGVHFMRLFPRAFISSFFPSAASSFPGNLIPGIFFHTLRTISVSSRRSASNHGRLPILSGDALNTN
jgi:hypothetical protein